MSRDYKSHKRRSSRGTSADTAPGWVWLVAGLTIGLAVALGIYAYDRRAAAGRSVLPQSAVTEPVARATPKKKPDPQPVEDYGTQYDFYEMLPKYEVVIPEREQDVRADHQDVMLTRSGTYMLQAGSFQNFADADRMKATLGLLGVESRIQKVTIDNRTWHRARIGPVKDLGELNRLRRRLREAKIEILVIRVGD